MLQNLANKPSYAKEEYMMMLGPFIENNKSRINKFLNELCEVGDFYESLEVCISLLIFANFAVY
jgi:Ras GTPase-activating-like protein IQGAP2/3